MLPIATAAQRNPQFSTKPCSATKWKKLLRKNNTLFLKKLCCIPDHVPCSSHYSVSITSGHRHRDQYRRHRHSDIRYLSLVPEHSEPDWVPLFRYRTGSGTGIFVYYGTGLTQCRIVRQSGIYKTRYKYERVTYIPCASTLQVMDWDTPCMLKRYPARPYCLCGSGEMDTPSMYIKLQWFLNLRHWSMGGGT